MNRRIIDMTDTRTSLLDLAENNIRQRGYHAVSFRELADELGIKSASVHYHFRQKEDLGLALVERYSKHFFEILKNESVGSTDSYEKVEAFCQTYKNALNASDKVCLCGILGAETTGLPPVLNTQVSAFFQANIDWVESALPAQMSKKDRASKSQQIVATLQGAMMLSVSLGSSKVLDRSIDSILQDLKAATK